MRHAHSPRPSILVPVLAILLLASLPATQAAKQDYSAVPTVAPAWKAQFNQSVNWQRVTPMGQLIVCTDCCLFGIDTATGDVEWSQGIGLSSYGTRFNVR